MQLIHEGRVISVWTAEQYTLVGKHLNAPSGTETHGPFHLEFGAQVCHTAADFMGQLRTTNLEFSALISDQSVTVQEKVEIYQAGLLVMILLDRLERFKLSPEQLLDWHVSDPIPSATC